MLDTHSLLWFQENNPRLSLKVKSIIENTDNVIFVSQVSLFEIAIKQSIGKLSDFKSDVSEIYHQSILDEMTFLPIHNSHLEAYYKIPLMAEHRDPFDRLLLATAYHENAIILSADKNFGHYQNIVTTIW